MWVILNPLLTILYNSVESQRLHINCYKTLIIQTEQDAKNNTEMSFVIDLHDDTVRRMNLLVMLVPSSMQISSKTSTDFDRTRIMPTMSYKLSFILMREILNRKKRYFICGMLMRKQFLLLSYVIKML